MKNALATDRGTNARATSSQPKAPTNISGAMARMNNPAPAKITSWVGVGNRCFASNPRPVMPATIEVNIAELKINHAIHASDLVLPDGVKLVDDKETVFFTVVPPKTEAVVAPVAEGEAEEAAQPEVIGKKKEDEEGEAEKGKEKK